LNAAEPNEKTAGEKKNQTLGKNWISSAKRTGEDESPGPKPAGLTKDTTWQQGGWERRQFSLKDSGEDRALIGKRKKGVRMSTEGRETRNSRGSAWIYRIGKRRGAYGPKKEEG